MFTKSDKMPVRVIRAEENREMIVTFAREEHITKKHRRMSFDGFHTPSRPTLEDHDRWDS